MTHKQNNFAQSTYRHIDSLELQTLSDLNNAVVILAEHLAIDFAADGIRHSGRISEHFTPKQRNFMLYLCFWMLKHPNELVSIQCLVDAFYPYPEDDERLSKPEHCLQQLATELRQQLGEIPRKPVFLCCERKKGYKLRAEPGYGYAFIRVYQPPAPPEFS